MYPDIIPYDAWIYSQLSIARHYGRCDLGGKKYIVGYIFAKEVDGLCKPDLIESKLYAKMQKKRKEKTKAYFDKAKEIQKSITTTLPF